ncbi:hypothetical protein C8R45DRAFT_1223306 [Mycena sanguinolenta]|nr:hypothetical protein C8R45DRAFT_1223306 [Mycena sanguinolenta]
MGRFPRKRRRLPLGLDIADFDITTAVFFSFLTRSTPPLSSLRMVLPNIAWEPSTIVELFQLMPNLTDLELYSTPSDDDSDVDDEAELFRPFLEVLGTDTDLLQSLRHLTLWAFFGESGDYEAVISVLAARRVSLRSFRLCFPPETHQGGRGPLASVAVVALRQFVEDGINVHVGPLQCNLVV